MRFKGNFAYSSVFVIASLLALTGSGREARAQAADCSTRHFYNNSRVAFKIEFNGPGGSCRDTQDPSRSNPCTIAAGSSTDLYYGNWPRATWSITIKSLDGNVVYPENTFQVIGCKIIHSGNTGNIVVNDPADGDVATCGTGYACR
jgi:hypothetical protein